VRSQAAPPPRAGRDETGALRRRVGSGVVGGFDQGGEPVQVGRGWLMGPHVDAGEQIGVGLLLARLESHPDRRSVG